MAKTLKKYNWDSPSVLTRTEKATYPWDQWLDGRIWKLTQGEDFHPHPLMMERIIRTRATGRGAKIRMRHEALNGDETNPFGIIVLQRTDIAPPEVAPAPASKNGSAKNGSAKKAAAPAVAKATPAKAPAAKKVAPAVEVAPAAKSPVKRAPARRSVKVEAPAPLPSKKASKKILAPVA